MPRQGSDSDEEAAGSWLRAAVPAAMPQVLGHRIVGDEHMPCLQGRQADWQLGFPDDLGGKGHS